MSINCHHFLCNPFAIYFLRYILFPLTAFSYYVCIFFVFINITSQTLSIEWIKLEEPHKPAQDFISDSHSGWIN